MYYLAWPPALHTAVNKHDAADCGVFSRPMTLTFDLSTENWHFTYSCRGDGGYQF